MPTVLTGSAQPVPLGGGYALRAPGLQGSADMHAGAASTSRAGPSGIESGMLALDTALRAANVIEVRQIDLDLRPTGSSGGSAIRGAGGEPALELEVPDAGPDHGQLVLSIDDAGALRWHLPEPNPATAANVPAVRGAGTIKRFRIPVTSAPPPAGVGPQQRSVFGAVARRVLKVLVYPLTDPVFGAVSDFFAKRWEASKRPYRLRGFQAADFNSADVPPLNTADVATMATAGPVLLFIHGTFSTTHTGFGGLTSATVGLLNERYSGRVIAVDHPTLGDDPLANVEWLVSHLPKQPITLDVVSHSRGGLVARLLAEQSSGLVSSQLATDAAHIAVHRLVLAGVPNAGTLLADPDHMVDMIDRFTTALTLFPTGPTTETLEALVVVLKIVGHGSLAGLPGLAVMRPDGEFLSALNASGGTAREYFAVASNYRPDDRGLRALVSGIADNLVDRLFGAAGNDLVVPTDGVFQRNGNTSFPLATDKTLLFKPEDGVMHTHMFEQAAVSEKLLSWLA
jgi:hypothetical protein